MIHDSITITEMPSCYKGVTGLSKIVEINQRFYIIENLVQFVSSERRK